MIMNLGKLLLLPVFLIGCNDQNINNNTPHEIINVSSDLTLTSSSYNKQYIITKDNTVLNLGTKTIHVDGDYQAILVRASGVTIKNGAIQGTGFETGVQIPSCITVNDVQPLIDEGVAYENNIYNRCSNTLKVESIHFENLKTGIYISDYVKNTVIHNNIFKNIDRMGVYISPGVTNTIISYNRFLDNGYRNIEGSGRPRGSISVDSAYGNIIKGNYFNTKPKWVNRLFSSDYRVPEIEFYRNCGEPTFGDIPLPRVHGADSNIITNNTFENVGLVAWFKYRNHHQLSNCVGNYPDKADNNTLTGSTLINIKQFVIDEGVNNTW